ncbi:MAG: sulfurtransferase complex subunit TusB [Halopseudomonas sp.]|uniref:sulfurtransferase complex subunit TusB n=1 Tax=Halopseudomonas sp. TaxID=2901191 RepID=UPI0030021AD9
MLHLLRHAPQDASRFASSLRVMGPRQGLLLLEDGVYSLLPRTTALSALQLLPASVRLYALEADVVARGLPMDDVPKRVKLIDYPTFVRLCTEYDKVLSW